MKKIIILLRFDCDFFYIRIIQEEKSTLIVVHIIVHWICLKIYLIIRPRIFMQLK